MGCYCRQMLGRTGIFVAAVISAGLLAGCTPTSSNSAVVDVSPAPDASPVGGGSQGLPTCDEVTTAIASLLTGLSFDPEVSSTQTNQEAYKQRVCVFTTEDGATQLGVTIAEIAFSQTELDAYSTLPNVMQDSRRDQTGAVLQTLYAEDGLADHLDSPLYLFDTEYSITIQGLTGDESTALTLPLLTVGAAVDAAFAIRGLI